MTKNTQDVRMPDKCWKHEMARRVARNSTDNRGGMMWDLEVVVLDTNLLGNGRGVGVKYEIHKLNIHYSPLQRRPLNIYL